jgi:hypothetical protein
MLVLMREKVISLAIDLVGLMMGFLLGFPFFHIFLLCRQSRRKCSSDPQL